MDLHNEHQLIRKTNRESLPFAIEDSPTVINLFSKLLDIPTSEIIEFLKSVLDEVEAITPAERLIWIHILLSNIQSLKILAMAENAQGRDTRERYINMYSRVQGVMRRWINTLKDFKNSGDKKIELIYTLNQLNVTPSPNEKSIVQKRRFNNLKHGLQSGLLDMKPDMEDSL